MQTLQVGTALVAVCAAYAYHSYFLRCTTPYERNRGIASAIRTAGALFWPLVMYSLIHREDRGCKYLAVPVVWSIAMWTVDLFVLHFSASRDPKRPASLTISPMSVTAFAFGLSGLIGAGSDSRYLHFFLIALLCCSMTVMPSHNFLEGSVEETVMDNLQRTTLLWCVGLMVTGVILTRSLCAKK